MFKHLPEHELVEENQVFRNDGSGRFVPVPEWGLNATLSGRSMGETRQLWSAAGDLSCDLARHVGRRSGHWAGCSSVGQNAPPATPRRHRSVLFPRHCAVRRSPLDATDLFAVSTL